MSLLLTEGRMSLAVRKPLRAFVAAKKNKNEYINNLIEKDLKQPKKASR